MVKIRLKDNIFYPELTDVDFQKKTPDLDYGVISLGETNLRFPTRVSASKMSHY